MNSIFGKRPGAGIKPYQPLRRGEAAAAPRQSTVQRIPRADEAIVLAAADAWNDRAAITHKAVSSSLRFIEFVRAYMAAFGAGFATYLLLGDLMSRHFNIVAMIAAHLSIITAPFYALLLAPAIFSLYSWTRAVPASEATRIYLLGLMPGALLLLGLARNVRSIDPQMIGMALAVIASGLVAAHTFNRSAAKIRAKCDTAAP
ncbi:hypothetical protein [Hyphomicrobium sp.]|jgi:hypothetical protein|uniref:hypothetical protein n=1 Tax=Hyphomicrobium sp. TaxID=82 RepID=UPI003568145D